MSERKSDTSGTSSKRFKLKDEVEVVSDPPTMPSQTAQPARPVSPPPPPPPLPLSVEATKTSVRRKSTLFYDPEADFEIISRDGVSIRVHSYMLLAHSSHFRTLLVGPNVENPYEMRCDTARTLEDLLTVMHGKPLWDLTDYNRLQTLIEAAQRLDCALILQHIKAKIIETLGQKDIDAFGLFIAGARLNCAETCRRAIPLAARRKWTEFDDEKEKRLKRLENRVPGHSVLDIRAMPEDTIAEIPARYLRALGRAMLLGDGVRAAKEDWKKIADEFYRLLTEGE